MDASTAASDLVLRTLKEYNPNLTLRDIQEVESMGRQWRRYCKEGCSIRKEHLLFEVIANSSIHVVKQFFVDNDLSSFSDKALAKIKNCWQRRLAANPIDCYEHLKEESKRELLDLDAMWSINARAENEKETCKILLGLLQDPSIGLNAKATFYEKHEIAPQFRSQAEIQEAEWAMLQREVFSYSRVIEKIQVMVNHFGPEEIFNNERFNNFILDVLRYSQLTKKEKVEIILQIPLDDIREYFNNQAEVSLECLMQLGVTIGDFHPHSRKLLMDEAQGSLMCDNSKWSYAVHKKTVLKTSQRLEELVVEHSNLYWNTVDILRELES